MTMLSPEFVLAHLLGLATPQTAQCHAPRVEIRVTGDETPSSATIAPLLTQSLPTNPIGEFSLDEPTVRLVEGALGYIEAIATALPGNEEADEIVERLIRRRTTQIHKLPRR